MNSARSKRKLKGFDHPAIGPICSPWQHWLRDCSHLLQLVRVNVAHCPVDRQKCSVCAFTVRCTLPQPIEPSHLTWPDARGWSELMSCPTSEAREALLCTQLHQLWPQKMTLSWDHTYIHCAAAIVITFKRQPQEQAWIPGRVLIGKQLLALVSQLARPPDCNRGWSLVVFEGTSLAYSSNLKHLYANQLLNFCRIDREHPQTTLIQSSTVNYWLQSYSSTAKYPAARFHSQYLTQIQIRLSMPLRQNCGHFHQIWICFDRQRELAEAGRYKLLYWYFFCVDHLPAARQWPPRDWYVAFCSAWLRDYYCPWSRFSSALLRLSYL